MFLISSHCELIVAVIDDPASEQIQMDVHLPWAHLLILLVTFFPLSTEDLLFNRGTVGPLSLRSDRRLC